MMERWIKLVIRIPFMVVLIPFDLLFWLISVVGWSFTPGVPWRLVDKPAFWWGWKP